MLIRNHPEGLYFNGTVGEIAALDDDCIQVYINGEAVTIPKVKWSQIDFKLDKDGKIQHDKEVVFEQYPIKWGWAMSIHKSQGQTLDKAVIDLGKRAFATGQTYVALSRCKTLQGLSLTRPIQKSDIKVDDDVLEFMKDVRTVE
jgi:ATP-dependent exoDNAse (exonuclease V) alpha subunit